MKNRTFIYLVMGTLALAYIELSPKVYGKPPAEGDRGNGNTVEGRDALINNTTGANNTALGDSALFNNTSGSDNAAVGYQTLFSNTIGVFDEALGSSAMYSNVDGIRNIALGSFALSSMTTGDSNTSVGNASMLNSGTVNFNTALGRRALFRIQGDQNIGLGFFSGSNARDGSANNIYIGNVGPVPIGSESNTIRIGTQIPSTATIGNPPIESHTFPQHTNTYVAGIFGSTTAGGVPVFVDANGQLGTSPSSQRFKDRIKPMDKASEAILSLRPVTFRYKKEIDAKSTPQFGLVAEEVEKVNPDLVARDANGKVYSVRYEAVNAMLLNEFLKAHRRIEEQDKRIDELTTQLKQQAALIQRVNDKVELSKPAPRTVDNN